MGALGMPSDIADATVVHVTSASTFIIGVVLPVDGGNSIGF